jgi:glucose-1-phosphate thymidylyltransferase
LYSSKVFDALVDLKPSARGEFEISDLHTLMIERGAAVGFEEITGWWKDTGTPNDLLEGNALLLQDRKTWGIRNDGVRDPSAVIRGEVSIGKGSVIGKDVIIRGPVAIGDNVTIEHSYIGPFTSIASGVTIHHATVENSIVFAGSTLRECHIVDSLIGERATINKKATLLPHGQRLVVGDNALVEL